MDSPSSGELKNHPFAKAMEKNTNKGGRVLSWMRYHFMWRLRGHDSLVPYPRLSRDCHRTADQLEIDVFQSHGVSSLGKELSQPAMARGDTMPPSPLSPTGQKIPE